MRASKTAAFTSLDWGAFAPLRLKARLVAEGVYAGMHHSVRKGAGVEFAGVRAYVPGDDLRFFDRRSLLKHDRWMVREFETETDRGLWLVVDATLSMSYRGTGPGAKYGFAALLAASLARVALSSGDPVGLVTIGGKGTETLPARAGRESFERIVWTLEHTEVDGDLASDDRAFERALAPIAERARRGSMIILFSDLIDLPPRAPRALSSLAVGGRAVFAVETLDPAERALPFREHARFASLEGKTVVDASPDEVRAAYQARLRANGDAWERELVGRGGGLARASTDDPPARIAREVVLGIASPGGAVASDGGPRGARRS
ncbi:MAG: DUF58 domain-containing protein [Polyangiaceae bacterium]